MGLLDFQKLASYQKAKKMGLFNRAAAQPDDAMMEASQASQPANIAYQSHVPGGAGLNSITKPYQDTGDDNSEFNDDANNSPVMAMTDSKPQMQASTDSSMPKRHGLFSKGNIIKDLLTVGLSALYTGVTNNGILPGLMAGLVGAEGGHEGQYQNDLAAQKQSEQQQLDTLWKTSTIQNNQDELGLKGKELDEKSSNDQVAQKIAQQNADANTTKANSASNKIDAKSKLLQSSHSAALSKLNEIETVLNKIPAGTVGYNLAKAGSAIQGAFGNSNDSSDALASLDSAKHMLAAELAKASLGRVNYTEYDKFLNNVLPSGDLPTSQRAAKLNQIRSFIQDEMNANAAANGISPQSDSAGQNSTPKQSSPDSSASLPSKKDGETKSQYISRLKLMGYQIQ